MANKISDETIEYVGILAKLELSEEEKLAARSDMERMLDYIDTLNELDTEGIEPMSHVFPVNNVFREDVVINGMPLREGAPHIMSISFLGIRSEVLLHTLEDRGIYVSAGSACSSHKRKPSATLSAMGMSNGQIENTVRFSFSEENTFEEIDYCLEVLKEVLPMLKRYARR